MLRRVISYNFADVSEVLTASIIDLMRAVSISKTSTRFDNTTHSNIPEDSDRNARLQFSVTAAASFLYGLPV
jgi:hypothetical protein